MPAPNPTHEELYNWVIGYQKFWNEGDLEGWIANYRTVLEGEVVRMLDPVGTPEKFGFENCCVESFKLFQDHVKLEIPEDTLFILDNTVAWLIQNHITSSGKTGIAKSLEFFIFEPDGSLTIRTWYDVHGARSGEIAASMRTYLPDSFS